jgi:probable F420-dependent oxidoreductase
MSVRVGVQVQPQHAGFQQMRDAWLEAEELGVDTIFTWDHFYPLYGAPDGPHFESLATLASMAEVTTRAQIGSLVMCNSYRNPELLADAHRTIDHISGGRVILGIGAGWFERDYDEYGYEFGTAPDRLRALARDLPRIRTRLGKLNPGPVGPMPILIGGSGPKVTLRLVAEHATLWHGFGDLANYLEKSAILAEHCAKLGRDPSEIEHTRGVVQGALLDHVDELHAAGVSQFIYGVGGGPGGYDLEPLRELLAWRDRQNG